MCKSIYVRTYILLFFTIAFSFSINGQNTKIVYSYDENGNRTSRILVSQQLKSAIINFPVTEPSKLTIAEDKKENIGELETTIRVYPNPTKGILKVEIMNLPENSKSDLKLYDLSGKILINQKNLNPVFDLDISSFRDGIYILRIELDKLINNWKIIKE
jgi:hypothetical protein